MGMFLVFLIACILAWKIDKDRYDIMSDKDLMERYIVFAHRKYRKTQGLAPLY